jgi:PAS domain S-box-containing protein
MSANTLSARNRLPLKLWLVLAAIAAFVACLGFASYRIIGVERQAGSDLGENLLWTMSQNETELLRFLDVLGRYGAGNDASVDRAELLARFDVLWSRFAVVSEGEMNNRLSAVAGARNAVENARVTLASVEDRVLALQPGDTIETRSIAQRLRALVPELREASVSTSHSELERMVERAEDRGNALMMALLFLLGLAASVGLLLLLLFFEFRRNGRLIAAAGEAEAAARLSEQRFRNILECSSDWVWETDAEHRLSMLSGHLLEQSGEAPKDVLGKTRLDRRLPEDADDANWLWHRQVLDQRLPFRDFIFPYRNAAGDARWARVHGRPLFDLQGGFLGYRGTGRDITEEIEAERALKESRSLLKAVIDAVPAVINLKDRNSRYVFMNRFQSEVYGIDADKAVGLTSADVTGDDYGEQSRRLDMEVFRSGRSQAFHERDFVDAQGRRRIWWTAKQPLKDEHGNVRHVVTVALDITDLKESERLRQNLSRYFSPNMVDLLAARDEPIGQVREQQVAVVFADLFDFTHYAAQAAPAAVMATLRDLHARMTDIVLARGGTLEKFLGDGLMATFGTPEKSDRDAGNALAAIIDMVVSIHLWNQERTDRGEPALRIGIGAHYGPVILGEIGSLRRVEFAVVGDTVNLANRLETLTRRLHTAAVISRSLVEAAAADPQTDTSLLDLFKPIPAQPVDGYDSPVAVSVLDHERMDRRLKLAGNQPAEPSIHPKPVANGSLVGG